MDTKPPLRLPKTVCVAAIIGLCVPIFWATLAFVFFSAPQSMWSDAFWFSVYATCPSWLLPENHLSWILTPALNGLMYGFLAWLVLIRRKRVSPQRTPF